ncbi:MAG: serine/threonine protein kinase [Fimbriimonadaceae bacterium]|nr:serine/threonine protein kinase [Fimbriimonadaceae bacterium]
MPLPPLPAGTVLQGRFRIESVLGRGGFGIAYKALDQARGDICVIKELAPEGALRDAKGVIHMEQLGDGHDLRMRQTFLQEAKLMQKLCTNRIPEVRASFTENGTAYYASDYIESALPLSERLAQKGRLSIAEAEETLRDLLETLEEVHDKGTLHRDIKPSNILLDQQGRAYLIDFGAAREWFADCRAAQTVILTVGYAPPEQLSEKARRGPATDLYGLAATLYHALTGTAPPGAGDRMSGTAVIPIERLRPDVSDGLKRAIEAGLEMNFSARPQTASDMLAIFEGRVGSGMLASIEDFDQRRLELSNLRFHKMECPECTGLLEVPRPLKRLQCPVCRDGMVSIRHIDPKLCPVCKASPLKEVKTHSSLTTCPICRFGLMMPIKKGLFKPVSELACQECEARFSPSGDVLTLTDPGNHETNIEPDTALSLSEWQAMARRSDEILICQGCEAQFDAQIDGRYTLVVPEAMSRYKSLYRDEWARVAANLPPGAGNSECDSCGADYFIEGDQITLIDAAHDPYDFLHEFQGRLMAIEGMRWFGVGKTSPHGGLVCQDCLCEFDIDGAYHRLQRTKNPGMRRYLGQPLVMEDWHRAARNLPLIAQVTDFETGFGLAIRAAYHEGQIAFDGREESKLIWRSNAVRFDLVEGEWTEVGNGNLTIDLDEITFGGLLKKWRVPFDAIVGADFQDTALILNISGEANPISFRVPEVELTASMESGTRVILLNASDLTMRLRKAQQKVANMV